MLNSKTIENLQEGVQSFTEELKKAEEKVNQLISRYEVIDFLNSWFIGHPDFVETGTAYPTYEETLEGIRNQRQAIVEKLRKALHNAKEKIEKERRREAQALASTQTLKRKRLEEMPKGFKLLREYLANMLASKRLECFKQEPGESSPTEKSSDVTATMVARRTRVDNIVQKSQEEATEFVLKAYARVLKICVKVTNDSELHFDSADPSLNSES